MSNDLFDFIKSAAEYSQETGDLVSMAYGLVEDINAEQQKSAALIPDTVTKLASLGRLNGQPLLPDGFEKQAKACLQSHENTIKLLNNVLNEYGQLKAAYDKLAPSAGSLGSACKTASERRNINGVSIGDSKAMRNFTERLANL